MLASDVQIGKYYMAKVNQNFVPVLITGRANQGRGYTGVNMLTKRNVSFRSPAKLRSSMTDDQVKKAKGRHDEQKHRRQDQMQIPSTLPITPIGLEAEVAISEYTGAQDRATNTAVLGDTVETLANVSAHVQILASLLLKLEEPDIIGLNPNLKRLLMRMKAVGDVLVTQARGAGELLAGIVKAPTDLKTPTDQPVIQGTISGVVRYGAVGVTTGRMQCKEPNLANIPKSDDDLSYADMDGHQDRSGHVREITGKD